MKNLSITIWTLAVILDFGSTIIQNWQVEENPLIRYIWHHGGIFGMIFINLFFYLLVLFLPNIVYKITKNKRLQNITYILIIPFALFKIIIALTNFGLIPYYWTGWFNY